MLTYFFMVCALGGGTIVLAQLILSFVGIGGGHGMHLHHHVAPLAHHGPTLSRTQGARLAPHVAGKATVAASRGSGSAALRPAAHSAAPPSPQTHVLHAAGLRDHWAISYLLGIFNLQGIVAGATVLGFAGLAASSAKLSLAVTLAIAIAAALAMMFLVGVMLRFMLTLDTDNTVQVERAVGQLGTVYLSIPPGAAGEGKIIVSLQHRLMEFPAFTRQPAPLSAGDQVIVIAVRKPSVMEVVSADKYLRDVEPLKEGPAAT